MVKPVFILFLIGAALCGCASESAVTRPSLAWDGLGADPNASATKRQVKHTTLAKLDPNSEREKVLTTLRPYSEAWWAVHDEIQGELDRQMIIKLVICDGCSR